MPTVNDSVKDLKAVLKREKAKGKFQGNFSTLRKSDLLSAVTQLGYAVSISSNTASTRRPRKTKTTRTANPLVYNMSTGVYAKTTSTKRPRKTKTTRTAKPKMFGPSLARGMTYKRLADSYAKSGNTQLAAVLPSVAVSAAVAPKRRGRPPKAVQVANPLAYTSIIDSLLPTSIVATAPKRRGRPPKATAQKMFGPSLPRGMTYKRLYDTYLKSGNTQLAAEMPMIRF